MEYTTIPFSANRSDKLAGCLSSHRVYYTVLRRFLIVHRVTNRDERSHSGFSPTGKTIAGKFVIELSKTLKTASLRLTA